MGSQREKRGRERQREKRGRERQREKRGRERQREALHRRAQRGMHERHRSRASRMLALATLWAHVLGVAVPAYGNGAADAIADRITAQAGQPEDFTRDNDTRGREQKANQSRNGANTGAIVAAIAGAALVVEAVPKIASGIPWEVAVGSALMAKAGLEFAQSAASAKTGAANGDQYSRLTLTYDESRSGANAQGPAQIQDQVAQTLAQNAELQNVLAQRGVDANQFAQQLASGQLQSTDAVLSAMKNDVAIDAATRAQAEAVAMAQTTQAVGDAMNKVQLQENAQPSGTASAAATGAPGATGGGSAAANTAVVAMAGRGPGAGTGKYDRPAESAAGGEGKRNPATLTPEKGAAAAKQAATNAGVGAGGLGELEDELLQQLMSSFGGAPKKREETAVSDKERDPLLALGVRRSVGNMTLFQLAHRNYRSFREWRTKKMAADRRKLTASPRPNGAGTLALKTNDGR